MERELDVARKAALEAGKILMKYYGNVDTVTKKDGSLVTRADRESEDRIKAMLSKEFPDYSFLGEETGHDDRKSEYTWVVDPLDGTTNYSIKNPFFNVSIALVRTSEPVMGVVYSPVQNELFHAVKGKGAYLNGKKISVSDVGSVKDSVIAFCHSRDKHTAESITRIFHTLKLVNTTFRQIGAAALELCYVASGRIECFMQLKMKPWDVAAGTVIVREAGGKVTNLEKSEFGTDSLHLLASNGKIHDAILKTIKDSIGEK